MSREVAKHTFFPFIKYQKNKDTKKIDQSKPPSIRAKVPYYDGKWAVEIYDTKQNLLFPCGNENLTPLDFVPKQSNVACVLQCGGIWIGGKGWGLTWKLIQCIVKPREIVSVFGKCQISLSAEADGICARGHSEPTRARKKAASFGAALRCCVESVVAHPGPQNVRFHAPRRWPRGRPGQWRRRTPFKSSRPLFCLNSVEPKFVGLKL